MAAGPSIDWRGLQRALHELTHWLDPIEIVSSEDWETYRLSLLTYGQIKSQLRDKIDLGYALLVKGGDDPEWRKRTI